MSNGHGKHPGSEAQKLGYHWGIVEDPLCYAKNCHIAASWATVLVIFWRVSLWCIPPFLLFVLDWGIEMTGWRVRAVRDRH